MRTLSMNRIFHRTMILLLIAALVTPLSAGENTDTQAPVCCLGKGEHHCMGETFGGDGAPAFSAAVAQCPYAPLALAAMHGPSLDRSVNAWSLAVARHSHFFRFENHASVTSSFVATSFERGPPTSSLN